MLVYCGQTVGWIKMKHGTEVGLVPGHIVLDGDPAPPRKWAQQPPLFGPCLLWPNGRPSQLLLSSCWEIVGDIHRHWHFWCSWLFKGLQANAVHKYCFYFFILFLFLWCRPTACKISLILRIPTRGLSDTKGTRQSTDRRLRSRVPSLAAPACLKPNSVTLASSELAPNMFEASSELVWSWFEAEIWPII